MIEITLYGRGGQGGVTLAKLIAMSWFSRGKHAQAFGVYAAERSGAPIQAYVRIDDDEITNHNQIREPDHVIVLDTTLIGEAILAGARSEGWLILNTPQPSDAFPAFRGRRVAAVDATSIAIRHGLGTRTTPIVNTAMLGAIARTFEFSFDEVLALLEERGYPGNNIDAAREAFDSVTLAMLEGEPLVVRPALNTSPTTGQLEPNLGRGPTIRTGSWATRRPERRSLTPPCNLVCPAGNDVQRFMDAAAHGDYDRALAVLLETSPFPGVCGRVCPAPCMESCNRNAFDEGVNVREVERFVADHANPPDPVMPWRRERIAVVGSGPAGMSAAYQLARRGYHVALYEASDELGGVLRNGIPDYRLPKDELTLGTRDRPHREKAARLSLRFVRVELLDVEERRNEQRGLQHRTGGVGTGRAGDGVARREEGSVLVREAAELLQQTPRPPAFVGVGRVGEVHVPAHREVTEQLDVAEFLRALGHVEAGVGNAHRRDRVEGALFRRLVHGEVEVHGLRNDLVEDLPFGAQVAVEVGLEELAPLRVHVSRKAAVRLHVLVRQNGRSTRSALRLHQNTLLESGHSRERVLTRQRRKPAGAGRGPVRGRSV